MLFVDGHTHLHDHVGLDDFLASADANFHRFLKGDTNKLYQAVLCLADFKGAEGFKRFQEIRPAVELAGWKLKKTSEEYSVHLKNRSGNQLYVISGRQIVTAEKLEVMALGTTEPLTDGLTLPDTLKAVEQSGSLPVLPWGVGKWLGRRGTMVESALDTYGGRLALCDNGGRPWFWFPKIYKIARKKGIAVLSGTDPLRISCDCLRVGSFVSISSGELDKEFPGRWVQNKLISDGTTFHQIGKAMSVSDFICRQYLLRKK